ncbi:MAG: serine/threonine-protein kinase [Pirellulaceae bacterium]
MVARRSACDPRRIRSLLQGQLFGRCQAELESHLETCEDCRHELETLAASADWWADVRRCLGRTSPSSIRMPATAGSEAKGDIAREDGADSLVGFPQFLDPSADPAMLGRLGTYDIVEVIGRGGMGVVLKGFDPELNRHVAIKILAPQLASSASARQRFAREARAAAAVVHDHVVAIHAVVTAAVLPYLVMPYCAGESLQQRIDRIGALELKEILRIGVQVADGLAAAHAQGLVHRDVKPANILLENGVERVKITDFGLARAIDDASVTHSGYLAGTPQYMAPEQARGEAVDHRADLFSLGSVLYAMATGHPPFRAETTLAILRRLCEDTPRSVSEVNPDMPDSFHEIIEKLHAKDREQRFQSALEVADLLGRHLAHLQQPKIVPRPPRLGYRSPTRQAARRRCVLRVSGAAVVTLIVGLAIAVAIRPHLYVARHPSAARQPSAEKTVTPSSPGESAVVDVRVLETDADAWDPAMPEIERVSAGLADLEMRMRPPGDSPTNVVTQQFSDVQVRLEQLESDISANGSE